MSPAADTRPPVPDQGTSGPLPGWVDAELRAVAARATAWFAVGIGVLVLILAATQAVTGAGELSMLPRRALLGAAMLAVGLLAWRLQRRGLARASIVIACVGCAGATFGHAWLTGLGVHNLAVPGYTVVLALAAATLGTTASVALGVLFVALALLLAWAESAGWLPGRLALESMNPLHRPIGLTVVGVAAIGAGLLIHRVLARALHAAGSEQRRLAELLRIGADWSWTTDPRGRLLTVSPSFEKHTGVAARDFLRMGQPGAPAVVDDERWQVLKAALRERRTFRDAPVTYRLPDGRELHVVSDGEPRHDEQGRFLGWWGMSRNVTREVQAERATRRERDVVQQLFELSPDPICVVELERGRVLLANPAFVAATGRPETEVIGRSGRQLELWHDPDDDLRLRAALQAAGGRLREWRSTVRMRGTPRRVTISAAAFERDGQPVSMLVVHDVTEAERERAQTEAILDNALVGIALVRERRFERVNPTFEQMFGHAPGTLAGQSPSVIFADAASYEALCREAAEPQVQSRLIDVEQQMRRPDGRPVLARLRGRAVDPQRPLDGMIWLAEDVTERRRDERDLAAARHQAEAANAAKSAFLATMSHEIRTPLNGVLGLARLLQDERDERRRREWLQHLVGAAEGLAGLVSDVLDLTKIEAGRVVLEDIEFDLHDQLQSAFHTFAPLGRERGLAMRCELAPDVPRRVRGDPVRVRQIVSNYLNNALKFTAAGSIALSCTRQADGAVRVSVTDSGIGIDPTVQERLFYPFSQADSSTTRRFGGTGLGLSICRELALLMGGSVGADGQPGHGSTFWVVLPLQAVEGTPAVAAAPAADPHPLAGMTVLVAEDNPVNMLIVRTMLERHGACVLEAVDGAQAVALARRTAATLDAVLLDLHMPVQDGLQAARALRMHEETRGLPLIALSAAVLDQERAQARAAGLDQFLHKPVTEEELVRVLAPRLRDRVDA